MARTIAEIKQEMTDAYMAESAVREKYGFTATDTFDSKFSKVSIEGLLFYVVAFGIWVMEKLFDSHKAEVETMLAERMPHTTRWSTLPTSCLLCAFFAPSFITLQINILRIM